MSCGPDHGPPPPTYLLYASVVREEPHYLPGEEIVVRLSLTNNFSDPMMVGGYPPKIRVTPRWYERNDNYVVFSMAAGTQVLEIEPGGEITWEFTWSQKDNEGEQVLPGWYTLTFELMDVKVGHGEEGTAEGEVTVLIVYPQGAMDRNIALNESRTVNGVTVTLERVEMSVTAFNFYAFTILPVPVPEPGSAMIYAGYTVDGITKAISEAWLACQDDERRLNPAAFRHYLDPIPSDAGSLTFRITKIDDWEGPWEFEIPLD
jgi:hypothetical protein